MTQREHTNERAKTKQIVLAAGGPSSLSRKIGISAQAVSMWKRVPRQHVLAVALAAKMKPLAVRPDALTEDKEFGLPRAEIRELEKLQAVLDDFERRRVKRAERAHSRAG